MSGIGGYFGLELRKNKEYHVDAIKLNTGRNALKYILKAKQYSKIYLPYYTCEVLLQPIIDLDIQYEFYSIDRNFEPKFDFSNVKNTEAFLYINYFGLKSNYIIQLKNVLKNIIIDNAQAFFASPIAGMDTFYSNRKFFGVPDGAYLYTNKQLSNEINYDISFTKFDHLLIRIDKGAEEGYSAFIQHERSFDNSPILQMSVLTECIMQSIDYEEVKRKRRANYFFVHQLLKDKNLLNLNMDEGSIPMVYPLLLDKVNLRKKLIENKIYIPTYWYNVLSWTHSDSLEYNYAKNIIHLPIDQRYEQDDLIKVIRIIEQ